MLKLLFNKYILKGSNRSQLAKKHIFYSFFLKGISILVGLIFVPLLLNYLDAERYGIWLTLTSVVGWFTFFDAGLGNGLRNNLTIALAKRDFILAKEYISTTYAIVSITFLSVLFIFYVINPFLNWEHILNTNNIPKEELALLTYIVFTFFFLRFIFNLIGIVLMADQRPSLNNAFSPISNIVSLIIIYILTFYTKGNLIIMGFVMSFIPLFVLIIATFFLFKKKYINIKPSFKNINWDHSKILLGLGFKFFIMQIASLIMFTTSNMIIAQVLGPEQVTIYNIAFKYFQIPIMAYAIIMTPIWSAVTDAYARDDYSWMKNALKKLNLLSLIFAFGVLFMLYMSQTIYQFWVGDKIKIPFIVSFVMAIYTLINIGLSPYSQYINGMGKLYISTRLVFLIFFLYIPLAIFLAKTQLQVAGVLLATIIINGIGIPIQIIQTNKLLNKTANGFWNK